MATLLGIVVSGVVSPAWAGFISGNRLHGLCQSEIGSKDDTYCIGYVTGVVDAIKGVGKGINGHEFCSPYGITARKLYDVVQKWLDDNPQKRHRIASLLIAMALSETWPCPK